MLVRAAGEEVAELLEIGSGLRRAWSQGTDLAEWEGRRNRVVPAVMRTAGELAGRAGHPLRDQVRREVEETLQAAVGARWHAETARHGMEEAHARAED